MVQELVSAEKTPTISHVLPMYEKLVVMLTDLKRDLPELSHAISETITKLEEYLAKSRKTKFYALAIGNIARIPVVVSSYSHHVSHQPYHQV